MIKFNNNNNNNNNAKPPDSDSYKKSLVSLNLHYLPPFTSASIAVPFLAYHARVLYHTVPYALTPHKSRITAEYFPRPNAKA